MRMIPTHNSAPHDRRRRNGCRPRKDRRARGSRNETLTSETSVTRQPSNIPVLLVSYRAGSQLGGNAGKATQETAASRPEALSIAHP